MQGKDFDRARQRKKSTESKVLRKAANSRIFTKADGAWSFESRGVYALKQA